MANCVVFGLGNPGKEFIRTRHNIGMRVVNFFNDEVKKNWNCITKFSSFCRYSEFKLEGGCYMWILKYSADFYMNESGKLLSLFLNFLIKKKMIVDKILIVHDDISFDLGDIRLRKRLKGSAGHQGINSIICSLGEKDFFIHRLRVGVGRGKVIKEWVLKNFSLAEENLIANAVCPSAVKVILEWVLQRKNKENSK